MDMTQAIVDAIANSDWHTDDWNWMHKSPNIDDRSDVDGTPLTKDVNAVHAMAQIKRYSEPLPIGPVTPLGHELGVDHLVDALVAARRKRK